MLHERSTSDLTDGVMDIGQVFGIVALAEIKRLDIDDLQLGGGSQIIFNIMDNQPEMNDLTDKWRSCRNRTVSKLQPESQVKPLNLGYAHNWHASVQAELLWLKTFKKLLNFGFSTIKNFEFKNIFIQWVEIFPS